jgi:NAD(P)-dependent dehydrogenase (short-subunit alcohol dehydrogenase family)
MDYDAETSALAVITGASSPMALALARQLALWHFDLLLVADDDGVDWVTRLLQSEGHAVDGIKADLGTAKGLQRVYAEIIGRGQQVQLLVLNTGLMLARRLLPAMARARSGAVLVYPDAPTGFASVLCNQLTGTAVTVSLLAPVTPGDDLEEHARRAVDMMMVAEVKALSRAL